MARQGDSISQKAFAVSVVLALVFGVFWSGVTLALERSPAILHILSARNVAAGLFRTGIAAPPDLLIETPENAAVADIEVAAGTGGPRGWRAVSAFDKSSNSYVVKLFDANGAIAHEWKFNDGRFAIDPLSANVHAPHGLVVLPDGRIILNSDLAMFIASYDACGNNLWTRREAFHHQITMDENGRIWVWRGSDSPYSQDQWIESLDNASGKTVESISLRADILGRHPESLALLGLPPRFVDGAVDRYDNASADIFHPNDVEPLPSAYAERFPAFAAGDLLISFRNMDLVAVVDRTTHAIKWAMRGPWRRQHDPDFMPTGEIAVFNNNSSAGDKNTIFENRSSIVAVNPASGKLRLVLGGGPKSFFTNAMGAHDWIAPERLLVTVPYEGRVLAVDLRTNRPTFEFNNRVGGAMSANIAMSVWLPEDYFDVDPRTFECAVGAPSLD
jgi:hypothetical protein